MKNPIIHWWIAVAFFSYLYYNQEQGYNTVVFTVILTALVAQTHPTLKTQTNWWKSAALQLLAAVGVAWHGLGWGSFLYVISFFVFVGFTMAPQSTVFGAWLNGILSSMVVELVGSFASIKAEIKELFAPLRQHYGRIKPSIYLMPLLITIGFYGLYCWANPAFWVDFSWAAFEIDFWLVGFVLMGLIGLCPLFFFGSGKLPFTESVYQEKVIRTKSSNHRAGIIALKYENRQGVILFFMLNLLIVIFLLFNVAQLLLPSLQQVKGFSQQVHEGFNALLVSIVSAMALIVYYFRANQNFYAQNRRLLQLAFVWIVLNAALGLFTCYKNSLYVVAFGLTFKRIGVYFALVMTFCGLVLTFIKIKWTKSTAYLVRQTMWAVYLTITFYCLFDWSRIITWYNLTYAQELDMDYIQTLGPTRLPLLQAKVLENDIRLAHYKYQIQSEIQTRKQVRWVFADWQSRNWDDEWLRKTLK